MTGTGEIVGTPTYMSPEQILGSSGVTAATDVYALGAMLYHVLSGRPPYSAPTAAAVLAKVLEGPPEGLSPERLGVVAPLVSTCERAMSRDIERRFPSAHELLSEVEAWLDGARRREQGLRVVTAAAATIPEAEQLRAKARILRQEASELLAPVRAWQDEIVKAEGWSREDEAEELERRRPADDEEYGGEDVVTDAVRAAAAGAASCSSFSASARSTRLRRLLE